MAAEELSFSGEAAAQSGGQQDACFRKNIYARTQIVESSCLVRVWNGMQLGGACVWPKFFDSSV